MSNETKTTALALIEEFDNMKLMELDEQRRMALGKQIQTILPAKFADPQNALLYVFYCRSIGANPFRDEVYGWEQDGKLQVCDSYKALVRWAQSIAPYTEWFEDVEPESVGAPKDSLVKRCWILLDKRTEKLKVLSEIYGHEGALERVASSAVGVVMAHEMYKGSGQSRQMKAAPKTWTWDQRAETRALRNCIKRSHGEPSTQELQEAAWLVNNIQTVPQDWAVISPDQPGHVRELEAAAEAIARESRERIGGLTPDQKREVVQRGNDLLHGDPDLDLAHTDPDNGDEGLELPSDVIYPQWLRELKTPKQGIPFLELTVDQLITILETTEPEKRFAQGARLVLAEQLRRTKRPYTPMELKAAVLLESGLGLKGDGKEPSVKQKNLLRMKLDEIFVDTTDPAAYRHSFTKFLLGKTSTEDLTHREASALIALLLEKDKDTRDWFIQDHVSAEAFYCIRSELKEKGQVEMFLENMDARLDQDQEGEDLFPEDDTPEYEDLGYDDYNEDSIPF